MNKRNVILIISILAFIVIIGGVSYSYFVYSKKVGDISLNTGDISINLSGVNGNQTLTNVIPLTDYDGKNSSSYFDFTVNSTVDTERIYYEVYLLESNNNTLDTRYLKTYLTDQSNNEVRGITIFNDLGNSEIENGKVIYKGIIETNQNGTSKTETKALRLRLWLDESYNIQTSKTFNFDIYLFAKNVDNEFELPFGANILRKKILAKEASGGACSNITWTDQTDNTTYLSGTNECIDMNYVWYSGKLWRITSIYSDGAMKLVTQNSITAIAFNENNKSSFYTNANNTSYMYKWLNEEFYETLYYGNKFIDNTKTWNATMTSSFSAKPSATTLVNSKAGLLNSFEVYNTARCVESADCTNSTISSGFIDIYQYLILLNSGDSTSVWAVMTGGTGAFSSNSKFSVRPAIYLKGNVEFTGNGTINNPFKVVGDKSTGKTNELINTRISGEYIKLKSGSNEKVYRIVNIEDNKTKIVAINYINNGETRYFATGSSDTMWGEGTTTDSDTWYTYLNGTYYTNLVNTYGNLFDTSTYYLGTSGLNYKLGVCANTTSGNTKVCDKTTNKKTLKIGLLRYGEMFAAQRHETTSVGMWYINRYTSSYIWGASQVGNSIYSGPNGPGAARETLHLKDTVKIVSGTGTENDPYVVGL